MGRRRARAVVLASAGALVLPGLLLTGGARAPQGVPWAAPAAGTWQQARPLRLPAPSPGQLAGVNDIACPAPGNCVAVGGFDDGPGNDTIAAFTASEVNRRWEPAAAAYGTTGNSDPYLETVSCSSVGNCVAGGYDGLGAGLILTQAKGRWVRASYFPYSDAEVYSVSCPPKASRACAAGGYDFSDEHGTAQAWLLYETANGGWRTLTGGGGLAALNHSFASVTDVSCPSAGNCAAGGFYTDARGKQQAFVLTEKKGVWGKAREVAGSLNSAGYAEIDAVSCASAGNCLAVGGYERTAKPFATSQGFEVTERSGGWLPAREVPGLGKLNTGGSAEADTVSCAPASGPLNCAIGGSLAYQNGNGPAFVDQVRNGTWQASPTAVEAGSYWAQVSTVSCPAVGDCAAGGFYSTGTPDQGTSQAFLVNLENFRWTPAAKVPGTTALNSGGQAALTAVSCPSAGFCAAGGYYMVQGRSYTDLPFTVDGAAK
jgi:hypothetical protein